MAFSVRRPAMRLYLLLTATGFFGTFLSTHAKIQSATWSGLQFHHKVGKMSP
ncbi:MAG: hypothetical protein ACXW5W_24690 [Candidatus Binatia bacterium]